MNGAETESWVLWLRELSNEGDWIDGISAQALLSIADLIERQADIAALNQGSIDHD